MDSPRASEKSPTDGQQTLALRLRKKKVALSLEVFTAPNCQPACLPALDMQLNGCIYCAYVDTVFKALADPSRRELLDRLHANNGQTLSELCEHLDITRQAVTKHLALLEAANLVVTVWRGREKLHYMNPSPLHEIYERWIGKYERYRLQALSDLKKGLEKNQK